jgi:hypothetical protein
MSNTKVKAAPTSRDEDTIKAIEAVERCAKFSALSVAVDIGTTMGSDFMDGHWLSALRTIWKVTLAIDLWQVGRMYRSFPGKDLQKTNKDQNALQLLKILNRMTQVWRVTATMVFLTTTTGVFEAWGTHIPLLRDVLIALVLTVIACVFFYSSQETKEFTNVGNTEDPFLPRIEKKGAVLVRAMGMACAALFLKVALLPIIALSTVPHSWKATVKTLLNIPTPLALTTCLLSFRRSYINILFDMRSQPQAKKTDDRPWQPESQQQLAQEAQKFYTKMFSTLRGEIISKTLFAIRSFFW